ncbi:Fis family two component sigma54 specific transcriptional regulator [Rhodopirellula maiorica SM1]|uniref:Fis family two component sigma54 specific transcriptional regulator n=1 Tax=Rhodopirellula maiorica SM1 TaxID=1265738 RepID=M5S450_9BACT|nr:sigma-54 dependent transcriptional regulator [Rhodopirellula maiorica]EMI20964.1 Fis family two component sigma54 specific transcriptional regulator [Rhodopirellula maiorica SM1]
MNDSPLARILIADDEPLYLRTTGELLRKSGYECVCVADANAAMEALRRERFDLVLSDLNMPGNLKLELLREERRHWSHIPLIVITGVPSVPTAIESIRLGIADYLLKPVSYEDLLGSVQRVLAHPSHVPEATDPANDIAQRTLIEKYPEIVGNSLPMLELLDIIDRVAQTDTNILITGESGTGKEVVARAIHDHSQRKDNNFQVIDCTAIPDALFESVLFGHVKGSFTGAVKDQTGLLSHCHQGTAFFDELGELPATSQAKLLRAIQEQIFTPVGKSTPVQVDTRFICATNRNLETEVREGRFRQDLYYRLGVIHIELPPLRERGEDCVLLAKRFLSQLRPSGSPVTQFSDETLDCFRRYEWPGNIRELRNAVERAIALSRGETIEFADLPEPLRRVRDGGNHLVSVFGDASRDDAVESAEHSYLSSLIEKHAGNISNAAQQAGLSRQGMHKLLKKHGIAAADYRK